MLSHFMRRFAFVVGFAVLPTIAVAGYPFWVEKVNSSRHYPVEPFGAYSFAYSDRDYVFTDFPVCLQEMGYVVTTNGDKFSSGNEFMLMTSEVPIIVLVGYDTRYPTRPSWLNRFRETNLFLSAGDPKVGRNNIRFRLYEQRFGPGQFWLGGNIENTRANFSMYTVLIGEQSSYRCEG